MSDIKNLPKSLPDMNHTFQIDVEGQITAHKYMGEFSCKIPNAKEQALIAKHKAMLNGGFDESLDFGTKTLHHMVSYLRYTLTEVPNWWKNSDLGYELFDVNVIEEVYAKVLKFEQQWLDEVWGEPEEESKAKDESDK